jgi:outer membrane protein
MTEAVKWGLEASHALEAERLRLKALGEQQIQARNLRRPTIQFDATTALSERATRRAGSYEWNRTEPGSVTISANQPLMLGGRFEASLREADLRVAQARARLRSQELATVREIIEAYVNVRRDHEIVSVREDGVATLLRQLEGTRVRQRSGMVGITEVSQVEIRLVATRNQLLSARVRLQASWASLERLMGRTPTGLTDDTLNIPTMPTNVQEAIDLALSGSHDLKVARFTHDIARATARRIQAETAPRTSLQAELTASSDAGFNGARNVDAQIGARFSVPLWSGGQPQSRLRAALYEANAARVEAQSLEGALKEQVIVGMAALSAAQQSVELSVEQVRAAGAARTGTILEFDVGLRSTIDVLNQEQEWQEAKVALASVQAEYVTTQAGVAVLLGIDPSGMIVPDLGLPSNSQPPSYDRRATGQPTRLERPLIGVFDALTGVDAETRSAAKLGIAVIMGPEP